MHLWLLVGNEGMDNYTVIILVLHTDRKQDRVLHLPGTKDRALNPKLLGKSVSALGTRNIRSEQRTGSNAQNAEGITNPKHRNSEPGFGLRVSRI